MCFFGFVLKTFCDFLKKKKVFKFGNQVQRMHNDVVFQIQGVTKNSFWNMWETWGEKCFFVLFCLFITFQRNKRCSSLVTKCKDMHWWSFSGSGGYKHFFRGIWSIKLLFSCFLNLLITLQKHFFHFLTKILYIF